MSDERIRELLVTLPRVKARPGFTDQVLARVAVDRRRRRRESRPLLAVAAAGLALALIPLSSWWIGMSRARDEAEQAALQAEHAALQAEIQEMRQLARRETPVLYLGGDGEVDLVLDLEWLARADVAADRQPMAMPAGYRTDNEPSQQ